MTVFWALLTHILRVIFLLNTLLGIYSLMPTKAERAASKIGFDDMQKGGKHSPLSDHNSEHNWEMKTHTKAQATPYTPRTLAFNTLDRQLPLRSQEDSRWA